MSQVQNSLPFQIIAGSIDCFGVLSNVLTLSYLFCNNIGSKLTTTLMKNQLIFDGLTSGFALCSLLCPDDLFDHLGHLTAAFCHLWVSRAIFWFLVLLSESNLVCVAVDRIRAVVFSSSYRQREKTTLTCYYLFIFLYSFVFTLPSVFTVEYNGTHCVHLIVSKDHTSENTSLYVHAYVWLLSGYLIPGLLMAGCHLKVVLTMRRIISKKTGSLCQPSMIKQHHNSHTNGSSHCTLSSFSRSFILSAIVMWSAFLVTHAYHTIYYILCAHGVVQFVPTSILRRVGIFVTVLNSAFNPMIMIISSPPFRRGLWKFFRSCKRTTHTSHVSDGYSPDNISENASPYPNAIQLPSRLH